jgi:hypothetical protein
VAISKQNFLLSALLSASTGLLLIQAGRTIASLANRGVTCTPRCALDLAAVAVRVKSVGRQLAASILFLAVMALTDAPCSRQPRIMLGKIREHWPTYHYKSGFNGRLGDLAVRPVCLQPLFANGAYTSMRMRNKSYADNSSLMTDSQVLQSPPAWASIIPPDCALVEFLSCAIRI